MVPEMVLSISDQKINIKVMCLKKCGNMHGILPGLNSMVSINHTTL
jgi:hypothetical protein